MTAIVQVRNSTTVMNKVYDDRGRVAVLYSPDYGAGWFTWNTEYPEMLYDPTIVHIVLQDLDPKEKTERIVVYATLRYPDAYLGGAGDLTVEWIPEGTLFRVTEYDGKEGIELKESDQWFVA
jgi:hypothetical protein